MLNQNTAYQDNLLATSWLGEVVDVEDPQKVGRIKVRVYGKFDDLNKEDIPWAYPGNNNTSGHSSGGSFFSIPKLGSIVSIKFDMGNIYHPEYYFEQKISDDVRSEISNDYPTNDNSKTSHVLLYDTASNKKLKIFFTSTKGLMLDFQETQINIKDDKSIDIHTASGKSKIELLDDGTLNITHTNNINIKTDVDINIECKNAIIDHSNSIELGKGASEKLVLGDSFLALFNQHTHIGNLGAPTSPPITPMTPTQHLSNKQVKTK